MSRASDFMEELLTDVCIVTGERWWYSIDTENGKAWVRCKFTQILLKDFIESHEPTTRYIVRDKISGKETVLHGVRGFVAVVDYMRDLALANGGEGMRHGEIVCGADPFRPLIPVEWPW